MYTNSERRKKKSGGICVRICISNMITSRICMFTTFWFTNQRISTVALIQSSDASFLHQIIPSTKFALITKDWRDRGNNVKNTHIHPHNGQHSDKHTKHGKNTHQTNVFIDISFKSTLLNLKNPTKIYSISFCSMRKKQRWP